MLGLRLAFNPDGPPGKRQSDFARIRSTVPALKRAFDLWVKRGAGPAKSAPKSASNRSDQPSQQEVATR